MQDVSRPSRQHFEHLDGESLRLALGVRGGHGALRGAGTAPPPRCVGALREDRHRWGRAHDPDGAEGAKWFITSGRKETTRKGEGEMNCKSTHESEKRKKK